MADTSHRDPLGREVTLSDAAWYGHIVRNHREMSRFRFAVGRTIEQPDEIRFSASDEACRLYYAPSPRQGFMICVVADVQIGIVKTAYLAKTPKQGATEWP